MRLPRIKATISWIGAYAALIYLVGFAIAFAMEITNRGYTEELQFILGGAVISFLLLVLMKMLWEDSALQKQDLVHFCKSTGNRLEVAAQYPIIRLTGCDITFYWDVGNIFRFDRHWMHPRKHPLWRRVRNRSSLGNEHILTSDIQALAKDTSALVVSFISTAYSLDDLNRMISCLLRSCSDQEMEIWISSDAVKNNHDHFSIFDPRCRVLETVPEQLHVFIFTPPWNRRQIIDLIYQIDKSLRGDKSFNE